MVGMRMLPYSHFVRSDRTTNVISFEFQSNKMRVVTIDGQPWFVVKDILCVLGMDVNQPANCLRRGWRPWARQMRCTLPTLTPPAAAMVQLFQCVASSGGNGDR